MPRHFFLILLWVITAAGCNSAFLRSSSSATPIESDTFIAVTAKPEDTLASLAHAYLGDAEKAWQIAQYNRIEKLTPGLRVIIPRRPLHPGGIRKNGYQLVPVLLYPELTPHTPTANAVSLGNFDLQMHHLQQNGFTPVSLDQFYGFLSLEETLPPNAVIISFDSTRSWVYEIAYPIIKKRGMKAVVFIRLSEVGAGGKLTWSQLAEMAGNGFTVGIYGSRINPSLQKELKKDLDAFENEFTAPQQAFKANLRQPCRYFAYAGGKSDDLTIAMLKKHGFRAAFTRERGANPFFLNSYKIKRSTIGGRFDMAMFRQQLTTFKSTELK